MYLEVPPVAYHAVATTRKVTSRLTSPQLLVSHCEDRAYYVAQCALVHSINYYLC